jgi:hypothetical protein
MKCVSRAGENDHAKIDAGLLRGGLDGGYLVRRDRRVGVAHQHQHVSRQSSRHRPRSTLGVW